MIGIRTASIINYIQRHFYKRSETNIVCYKMGQYIRKCFKSIISSDSASVVIEDQAIQTTISSETAAATSIKETYSTRPLRVRTIQNFTLYFG